MTAYASFTQRGRRVEVAVPDGTTSEQVIALYRPDDETPVVISATPSQEAVLAEAALFRQAVKAECGRRILAVASANAQMNMTATCAAGVLNDADKTTYTQSLLWIAQMRAACAGLIETADAGYRDDAKWPPCPVPVLALVARF